MSNDDKKNPYEAKPLKLGRPTKYKPEYCQQMIDYFNTPKYTGVTKEVASQGKQVTVFNYEAANMPLFEDFSVILGVGTTTFDRWREEHKDFRGAYRICKAIQRAFLITHGLQGNYNASFAKFMGINNHGMRDSSHVISENDHTHKGYGLGFDLSKTPEQVREEAKKAKDE